MNNSIKKGVVVAVILLFVSVSVIPSTGTVVEKKSTMPTFYDGNTLYVGGSGPNNYTKIQDAIDNASDGDTVFVYDDSSPYYEQVSIKKQINLVGENRDTTIIDGKGEKNAVSISAENVSINNFSIRNSSTVYTWEAGISITSNNNNITYCNIYSNNNGIYLEYKNKKNIISYCNIFSNKRYGIDSQWSYQNTLKNCIISNNKIGIDLILSEKWTISNNEFIKNGIVFSGYVITNVPEFRFNPFNHTIENNTVNGKPMLHIKNQDNVYLNGITAGQIIIVNCSNIEIKNLAISDTDTPIIIAFGKDIKIQNCNLFSNNRNGINFRYGQNIQISECNIYSNKENGLLLEGSSNCIVNNCYLKSNGKYGIGIHFFDRIYWPSKKYQISNCEIYENNESGIVITLVGEPVRITNCIIKENKEHGINLMLTRGITISYCIIDSNKANGIHLIDSNKININHNNFYNNTQQAYFETLLFIFILGKTRVRRNYWDDWNGIRPYKIKGVINIFDMDPFIGYRKLCDWRFLDWLPAKEPYDIGVG